ncbi:CDP-diacylglycerol--glycerol-3-phosphate 3-phosphatidyltransferase [Paludibaculum fermentans]|uniref:CDP-diacylglycerol--glycerol-3-phosphate 3-phosphatidyltransferase n=1 Tax=Paludibaculum fermentans TaxID=1473598 RepID=A0A7S7NWG8_PALFE|nr:CDP-diacylglycerol--glycerol-3-phosphate 3-phosphatidyltransferase [Paludibaculum fermentans]QOY91070.1 CDP-diacylglycerol--glycerol-3-phosphate 3-phosphatidyltransferase [Paludibaculum fermentans]
MNIPNALTLLRIFFVPMLVAVLVQDDSVYQIFGYNLTNDIVALLIFLAAAFTDLLDGYLARRWNQITTVGMLLDPIADKLLISAALISLVQVHRVPGWMAVLIIGREFAVSGLRSIAASEGYTIQASDLGKTKMVTQVVAISLTLAAEDHRWLLGPANFCLWGTMIFALASAADYARKFWHLIDESIKERRRSELLRLEKDRQKVAMKAAAVSRERSR